MAPRSFFPQKAGEPLIKVSGLKVAYGPRVALENVDLTLQEGEIVTLIGPNGAGKTSLVRAILGLVPLAGGSIWKKPNLRIGYMPQRLTVDATMPLTVHRFLSLWGQTTDRAILRTLVEVGASHTRDRFVHTLSGGEFQRVLLARALLRKPDILVLDEPVQAVDVQGQMALYALIDHIRTVHGCAVLMVSHDLHLVMAHTNRVICINGRVCCHGHPQDVGKHPDYLRLFGGAASAFAVYQHHHAPEPIPPELIPHCSLLPDHDHDHEHEEHGEHAHDHGDHAPHATATEDKTHG